MRYGKMLHILSADNEVFQGEHLQQMLGREVEITDDHGEIQIGTLCEFKVLRAGLACYVVIDIPVKRLHPSHQPPVNPSQVLRPQIVRSRRDYVDQARSYIDQTSFTS